MSIMDLSSSEPVSMWAGPERHTHWAWPVTITARASSVLRTRARYSLNCLVVHWWDFMTLRMPEGLSLLSLTVSQELISQSTCGRKPARVNSSMYALTEHSAQLASSPRTQGRRAMLALPALIDLRGSIVTLRRIRVVTFSALNLSSDGDWREMPQQISYPWETTHDLFPLSAILGDGRTMTGNRE